jgi:hypothetical protein
LSSAGERLPVDAIVDKSLKEEAMGIIGLLVVIILVILLLRLI